MVAESERGEDGGIGFVFCSRISHQDPLRAVGAREGKGTHGKKTPKAVPRKYRGNSKAREAWRASASTAGKVIIADRRGGRRKSGGATTVGAGAGLAFSHSSITGGKKGKREMLDSNFRSLREPTLIQPFCFVDYFCFVENQLTSHPDTIPRTNRKSL